MAIPKILIVDDEKDMRQIFNKNLSVKFECEVIEAVNGYEAIEHLQKGGIDLVLLDIKMPGISGREVIQKARELSKDTVIIVVTKYDSPQFSQELKSFNADYIPKPASLTILRDKVEEKLKAIGKLSLRNT